MKKILLAVIALVLLCPAQSRADEGMWLPLLLKDQKFREMRKMGLRLSAEEIYSVNQACIKDAVIGLMGEGANLRNYGTASFISADGLILTNYHVVLSYIERFSTQENDFLRYGYWARNHSEESLCRGLQIKQLVRMEDVTDRMLAGTQGLSGRERERKINENGKAIAAEVTRDTPYEVRMQALFGDSQYIMNVYIVYRDIRMVAAPPFALGKFGGNHDNYSWPRHTADFAILRVYANENNLPANHSPANVPYRPKHYLPISARGVQENDFVMVPGFPGSTRQYVPSFALERIIYGETAEKAAIAREKMNILKQAIEEDAAYKYRYTTRLSTVGNNYLRWKGEIMGVNSSGLVEKKRQEEKAFQDWVKKEPARVDRYGDILERMEKHYQEVAVYNMANTYFLEAGINGSEIVPFIGKFEKLVAMYNRRNFNARAASAEAIRLVALSRQFFNNWNEEVDRRMFRNLTYRYYKKVDPKFIPQELSAVISKYEGDIELLSKTLFANSVFTSEERLIELLESEERDIENLIRQDELYQVAIGFYRIHVDRINRQRSQLQAELLEMQSVYLEGLLEMNRGRALFPDANNSFRISYGKVTGTLAQDGLQYHAFTTLDGAWEKFLNNPDDEEYYLPRRLQQLHLERNYGPYAIGGKQMPVNFLTNAHTTSGSSGSPVINGRGELVGLNFDRIWQGVASDYRYEPDRSRNIAVDIRYILLILHNYPPNDHVISELNIRYK